MQKTPINATDAVQPAPSYVQAMHLKDVSEWLLVSGQIGLNSNGHVGATFEEQATLAWSNIDAQLRAAGMTKEHLVKVTVFLSDRSHIEAYRATRDAYLEGHKPALTCIIAGIFDEAWLLEIEAIAAR